MDPQTLDLSQAATVLDIQRARLETLDGEFSEEKRGSTAGLVSLQVQAAELTLLGLEWYEVPREGPLVPIDLEVAFSGDPVYLPILAHGVFNQTQALSVQQLELTFLEPDFVTGRLRLRFYRAAPLELDSLPPVDGLDPALASLAAEVAVRESARDALTQVLADRADNRRWLTYAVPPAVLAAEDVVLAPKASVD